MKGSYTDESSITSLCVDKTRGQQCEEGERSERKHDTSEERETSREDVRGYNGAASESQ